MTLTITAHANGQVSLPLSDIVTLQESGIPLVPGAIREIEDKTVEAYSWASEELPPVLIADTEKGPILIGGYHRFEAKKRKAIREAMLHDGIKLEELGTRQTKKAMEDWVSTHADETKGILKDTQIAAIAGNFHTENDIVLAALDNNLKNGLPPASRVKLALEYWKLVKGTANPSNGKNWMQKDVAEKFGINKATLNEYVKKDEKKPASGDDDGDNGDDKAVDFHKLQKRLHKVLEDMQALKKKDMNGYASLVREMVAPVQELGLLVPPPLEEVKKPAKKGKQKEVTPQAV